MGKAVECEGLIYEKYGVDEQLKAFVKIGGEMLAQGIVENPDSFMKLMNARFRQ
jgi:hypothetical protein